MSYVTFAFNKVCEKLQYVAKKGVYMFHKVENHNSNLLDFILAEGNIDLSLGTTNTVN